MEMKIIDEQLEDKQQIVTIKYLSTKLNIHPNKAKQLLNDYVSLLTDDKKYSITIVIGGTFQENDEFGIVLAYDDHIDTVRRRFKEISFEHLYSIQPISRFDDINYALYLVDNSLSDNVNLPSSIKKKEKEITSIPKQDVEIEMKVDVSTAKQNKLMPNEVLNNINYAKSDKTNKKDTDLNISPKSNKKIENTDIKVSPIKKNSNFFSKFKKSNNSDIKCDFKNEVTIKKAINEDNKKTNIESPNKKVVQEKLSIKLETKKNKKSNKKRENENKNKGGQKVKRKRIQTFNSSDEEIDSEEEDKKRYELVMDVNDEVDLVQPTPPRPTPREYRKKEKKITTSTFIDEDDFVCTIKEVEILETKCEPSEPVENIDNVVLNELNIESVVKKMKPSEPIPMDKKKIKNKQSKNSSSQGMKQSSLTSFFKIK